MVSLLFIAVLLLLPVPALLAVKMIAGKERVALGHKHCKHDRSAAKN